MGTAVHTITRSLIDISLSIMIDTLVVIDTIMYTSLTIITANSESCRVLLTKEKHTLVLTLGQSMHLDFSLSLSLSLSTCRLLLSCWSRCVCRQMVQGPTCLKQRVHV